MDLEPWQEREEDYLNLRDGVFRMLNSGGELADRLMDNMALFLSGKMQHTDIPRMKQLLIPTPEMWIAFFNLCGAPYFERLWTIQEFALSKSLTIQCGSESCDVRTLQIMHFVVDLNIKNIRVSPFPTPGFGEWGFTYDCWIFCGQRDKASSNFDDSKYGLGWLSTCISPRYISILELARVEMGQSSGEL